MRYSRIGVGAAVVAAVLAVMLLATLVVGASAATKKANHAKQVHRQHTTAHPMRTQGGTVPTRPPVTG
jgi:hypothetical protein